MKILVVSQYFHPEEFKVNELVAEFQKRGHEVAVLTGKPNYPSGKIFEGYKFWDIQYEDYKGARVTRVPLIPRGNGNGLRLSLNYLSFVLFGGIYVKTHPADYDAIICFEISPVTQMYPDLNGQKGEKVAELQFGSRIYGLKVLRRQERRIIHFCIIC